MSDEEYVTDTENRSEGNVEILHEHVINNEIPHLVDYEDDGVFINANNTGPNFVVGQPVNQYFRNNDVGINNEGNPFNGFVNYINGNPRNNAGNIPVNNGANNAFVRNNIDGNPANNIMHNGVINNNVNNNIPRNQGVNPPGNGGNVLPRNNQPRNGGVIPQRNNQPRNNPPENQGDDEEQNIFRLANTRDGAIMSYAIPNLTQLHTGIRRPHIGATHFSLKPIMFTMLQANGQFAGLPSEDPHSHLRSFMEITDSFLIPHVSDDALRLKLFPFSLRDRARAWYNSLTPDSVITWNQMAEKFLKKYFPPTRNAKSRNEICTFKQMDDEAVPDAL